MAAVPHSKGVLSAHGKLAPVATTAQPPPSTLAAQLAHNFSTAAQSSRPDENGELKKLFVMIEQVKNDPGLLKSMPDRVEHNHMLIYVYTRVVLENLRLDDPYVDRAHVRSEAGKAISFYTLTIKESPGVLSHAVKDGHFMCRGEDPLWVWLFIKLLRLLGHDLFDEITSDIERFFQFVLDIAARSRSCLGLASSILVFLREIHDGESGRQGFWGFLTLTRSASPPYGPESSPK
jgi:serine/threonine-protein kinase ATR